jgi:ATP-binding cassette subfamily F protein 2
MVFQNGLRTPWKASLPVPVSAKNFHAGIFVVATEKHTLRTASPPFISIYSVHHILNKMADDDAGAKDARAAARAAKKAQEKADRAAKKGGVDEKSGEGDVVKTKAVVQDRTATGILTSEKNARDIKVSSFSLSLYGRMLVEDTSLELNYGQRYGLLGRNGCGKSSLLKTIANREIPLPDHIDTYLLEEEAKPSEATALEYVINSAKEEMIRLEALAEKLLAERGPDCEELMDVNDRQSELDPSTFETRASSILVGLGFNSKTVHKQTKDMSGGWRMRVALARALFISPSLLLLDEPTNHLDLEACVWLEDYLSRYPKLLIVVSHSQDFLNGVCTMMMVMQAKKLKSWVSFFLPASPSPSSFRELNDAVDLPECPTRVFQQAFERTQPTISLSFRHVL